MAKSDVIQVAVSNFDQEVMKSDIPVLLDFGAPRCGPCKALEPSIFELAEKYKGKMKFCQINSDENPALAAKFQVLSIPAVFVLKGGQIKGQRGFCSKEDLRKLIDSVVNG